MSPNWSIGDIEVTGSSGAEVTGDVVTGSAVAAAVDLTGYGSGGRVSTLLVGVSGGLITMSPSNRLALQGSMSWSQHDDFFSKVCSSIS